jgi:hypothetical protein
MNKFNALHVTRVRDIEDGENCSLLLLNIKVGGTVVSVVQQQVFTWILGELRIGRERLYDEVRFA